MMMRHKQNEVRNERKNVENRKKERKCGDIFTQRRKDKDGNCKKKKKEMKQVCVAVVSLLKRRPKLEDGFLWGSKVKRVKEER